MLARPQADRPPQDPARLTDAQLALLHSLREGQEIDFGDRRALPIDSGEYVEVKKVKLTGVPSNQVSEFEKAPGRVSRLTSVLTRILPFALKIFIDTIASRVSV